MKVVLRAPCRGVNRQRNGAVRHLGSALQGHKAARLPGQPEKVRRMRFGQQRALGAVDAIGRHQQVLQRPVAVFKYHIACIRFHLRTRCQVTILDLIRHTLVENDMS